MLSTQHVSYVIELSNSVGNSTRSLSGPTFARKAQIAAGIVKSCRNLSCTEKATTDARTDDETWVLKNRRRKVLIQIIEDNVSPVPLLASSLSIEGTD